MGIEPTLFAWEARVLPLNDARILALGQEMRSQLLGCEDGCNRTSSPALLQKKHGSTAAFDAEISSEIAAKGPSSLTLLGALRLQQLCHKSRG